MLKARSAPLEEWIRDTFNTESHDHDEAWIGQVISRDMQKNLNLNCFNFSKHGHLKRDCKQGIPRNNVFFLNKIQT